MPTDWEESVAVAGEVGDFVVFARRERGGDDWYFGAITDEQARQIEINLDSLEPGGVYMAQSYRDGPNSHWKSNPHPIEIGKRRVRHGESLELPLAAGGGTAIRFEAGSRK